MAPPIASPAPIPAEAVGVGLKAAHAADLLADPGPVTWVEVHAENLMTDGGPMHDAVASVAAHMGLSIHGVGLSLGGAESLDPNHLARLREVVSATRPALVSEHLAWCGQGGAFLNDLLPVPYTEEALDIVCRHIDQTQEALGRPILVENPSRYFAFRLDGQRDEPGFLSALVARTGCGLLLDVNNIVVSAGNLGLEPLAYLDGVPWRAVGELHLAGHAVRAVDGVEIRIDDHGSAAPDAVLSLYAEVLRRAGPRPTLLERDSNLPPWAELRDEAASIAALMRDTLRKAA